MNLGDESGFDYSSVENYQSVDSKRFNNKLMIENTDYAEIKRKDSVEENIQPNLKSEYSEILIQRNSTPYATVDFAKKREERLKKKNAETLLNEEDTIYEDIGISEGPPKLLEKEGNIYEMVNS